MEKKVFISKLREKIWESIRNLKTSILNPIHVLTVEFIFDCGVV